MNIHRSLPQLPGLVFIQDGRVSLIKITPGGFDASSQLGAFFVCRLKGGEGEGSFF